MADVPINAVDRRIQFTGNTGLGPFAFTFNILADSDIAVYKNDTLLTLTTDYTISTSADGTGSVTLTGSGNGTALVTSDFLTIVGGRQLARTTDFVTAGDLLASSLNEQLDSNVIMVQQLDEKAERTLRISQSDVTADMTIPSRDDRKGKYLAFNDTTGLPEAGPSTTNVNSLAAITDDIKTLAEIEDGTVATDSISDLAAISTDVTGVNAISSAVTGVNSISTAVSNVDSNSTNINTVSTNIASVNTVATNISDVITVANDLNEAISEIETAADDLNEAVSEIDTVATNIANVNTVGNNLSGSDTIGTVATDIANVNLVGADIANVNTVATNIADVNNFADTYFISATAPASPTTGDLWFDTTNSVMKVYDGTGFVNAGSSVNGTAERQTYTATSGQTTFAATYDAGYVDVYLNGVKLIDGTDFTATSGSNIVLTTGAALNDTVDIVAYGTFDLLNVGGSLASLGISDHDELTVDASGNVSVSGTLGVTGNATLSGDLTVDTNTLHVDSASNTVGIGTASPSGAKLDIFTGSTATDGLKINRYVGGAYYSTLRQDSHGLAVHVGDGSSISERAAITPNGITFNGDTAAANALDDYEEGTFTAQITGGTSNPSTAVTATGYYNKIGKHVFATVNFANFTTTGASGSFYITGWPFSSARTTVGGNVMASQALSTGTTTCNVSPFFSNSTTLAFYPVVDSGGGWYEMQHNTTGTGRYLYMSVDYLTS